MAIGMDHETLRRAAVCASGVVYWLGVLGQAVRVRRRIGRSPNIRPRGGKERALWGAWMVVIGAWVGQPAAMGALGGVAAPAGALLGTWTLIAGLVLLAAGHSGTYWCYAALGDAWRIGIRRKERTGLVTAGPYARIRHPIYSFQILLLAAAALLLPTPLSAALLALHVAACTLKALDEEAYLLGVHGDDYKAYIARTGRFLPALRTPKQARI